MKVRAKGCETHEQIFEIKIADEQAFVSPTAVSHLRIASNQ